MKILITGHPGAGKTIFAKYLNEEFPDFRIIEFDDCQPDLKWFYTNIRITEKCIVVIQDKKLLKESIDFDAIYELQRTGNLTFQVKLGSNISNYDFLDFEKYMTP